VHLAFCLGWNRRVATGSHKVESIANDKGISQYMWNIVSTLVPDQTNLEIKSKYGIGYFDISM
jgi:hypothetical protein